MKARKSYYEPVSLWGIILGILFFLIILLFLDLKPGHPEVTRTLAVAVLMATWWVAEAVPLAVTALLPVVLFPMLGIMDGKEVSTTYFNHIIFLFLGGFMMALAMEKWSLHKRIALAIMMHVGVSPGKVLLGFMLATAFLSMWISNTATAMMMLPIALSIILELEQTVNSDDIKRYSVALFLGIAYSASIGGLATLVGTPPNLVLVKTLNILFPHAPEINFAEWMMMGLPISLTMLIVAWILLYFRHRPKNKWKGISIRTFRNEYNQLGKMNYEEKVVISLFILLAVMWLTRADLVLGHVTIPGWSRLLDHPKFINDGTVAVTIAVILFLIPSRNRPGDRILDWKTANRLPWNMILLFGGGFALAKGFEVSGLAVWFGEALKWVGQFSDVWILLTILTMMSFLTELTSNTASTQMLLPVFAGLAVSINMNPLLIMIPVTMAASLAFMLPTATPPNAIVFGTNRIGIRTMIKTGFWLNMAGVFTIYFFIHVLGMGVMHLHTLGLPAWVK
ncbi:MAG TPA: SLC13/DASS family transporter [Bacteroidetes bacterium]|nr:SLC13/DASS family transporter [Bacteroidota bacterium]